MTMIKYLIVVILMYATCGCVERQGNVTLHKKDDNKIFTTAEERAGSSDQFVHPKQPSDLKINKKTGNHQAAKKIDAVQSPKEAAANVTTSMYVFNDSPTEKEQIQLDFIRQTMKAIFGDIKTCNTNTIGINKMQSSSCVQECSCNVICHEAGNCCPDIQHKIINITTPIDQMEQLKPDMRPYQSCQTLHNILYKHQTYNATEPTSENIAKSNHVYNLGVGMIPDNDTENTLTNKYYPQYLVISKCPDNFTNKTMIEYCEREDTSLIQDLIPAIDRFQSLIYKNRNCAACHGITEPLLWDISSDCLEIYTNNCLLSTGNILTMKRIAEKGKCKVLFTPPLYHDLKTEQCEESLENDVIALCNVTGLWTHKDEMIQNLCTQADTTMHFYQTNGPNLLVYRNVFCFLCNHASNEMPSQCTNKTVLSTIQESGALFPNLKVVMAVDIFVKTPEGLGVCSPGDGISSNDMRIDFDLRTNKACKLDEFWDIYMKKCRQLICPIHEQAFHLFCAPKQKTVKGLVFSLQLIVKIEKNRFINTRIFPSLFETIYHAIDNFIQLSLFKCVTQHVEALAKSEKSKLHIFFIKLKVANSEYCTIDNMFRLFSQISTLQLLPASRPLKVYNIPRLQIGIEFGDLSLRVINFRHTLFTTNKKNIPEIILKPLFNCAKTKLNISEYNQAVNENIIKKLSHHDLNLQYSQVTNTVDICLIPYLNQWMLSTLKSNPETLVEHNDKVGLILTRIASMTSIISIIIVLITYSLFSELRFIPGKLFMILCVNLLLAQLFFIFMKNEGYNVVLCKFIGIGVHYFWLATIFAMSSCLFLMIRSIKSPMKQTNRVLMQSKSISKASMYILFTYITPLLIVLANLLTAWLTSQPYNGYGGQICYISTGKLRIYMFLVPVGIMVILNFMMFSIMLNTLVCVMKTSSKGNHQYIITFFKLSTITGMFWVFGYLYQATNICYFDYIFTVLNAGQGFFLMWSFIINRRVMNLYLSLTRHYFHTLQQWKALGTST